MHKYIKLHHFKDSKHSLELVVIEDVTKIENRFSPKQNYQRSIVNQCLNELLGNKIAIKHETSGRPFIEEFPGKHISISHTKDVYAIQLSDKNRVGVDVQFFKENLTKGKSYFVNSEDEERINLTELNLHLIWSAKEAVYKMKGGEIDSYKDGMTIIQIGEGKIIVKIENELIKCHYHIEEGYVLVYTLDT